MEKIKIKHFMPSIKMYKHMVEKEVTFFHFHNNSRFTVSSRLIKTPGLWVNPFRSVPYVYRWSFEEEEILPDHYKNRCREFMTKEPTPVHWRPDPRRYRFDEDSGEKIPVINAPVPVVFPKECNHGLWGGEGIIFGYWRKVDPKREKKLATNPRLWVPELTKRVLYSEILDRYMSIAITDRARYLIDEAFGLDHYILQTHEVDLCSQLAMLLKREMLVALAKKSFYPDNPEKRDKIYERYKQYALPLEEAEWVGLPVHEAVEKAEREHKERNPVQPLKDLYIVDLVKKLQLSGEGSRRAGGLSPFSKSSQANAS